MTGEWVGLIVIGGVFVALIAAFIWKGADGE